MRPTHAAAGLEQLQACQDRQSVSSQASDPCRGLPSSGRQPFRFGSDGRFVTRPCSCLYPIPRLDQGAACFLYMIGIPLCCVISPSPSPPHCHQERRGSSITMQHSRFTLRDGPNANWAVPCHSVMLISGDRVKAGLVGAELSAVISSSNDAAKWLPNSEGTRAERRH
ncbi:uncharacterized protein K460DRAFT_391823 [Cucurbitaria berberidis CBS 394.84]|uniref:Uncharacterized protein n=1 Tax=Cucurbitaria berberidis CBS 394.84 TaxID=1168544 RepID=A0A9P4LE78_9PLEO|nr:uncharacterized protein K460DRAFT_391823 [Cucurbitaria berberidis CBS 394.84]KAF1851573.1 hypothetical protein K460DRAFT_391823 [Cucurbitaria berberidis CBS 394.84]